MTTQKEFLESYRIEDYERPSLTTDVACFRIENSSDKNYRKNPQKKLTLLLIRRREHPYRDCWALPGGFLQPGETIEQCALREITEETALTPVSIMPVAVFSEPGRDPRGWIISNAFASILCEEKPEVVGGDDAADARWFEIGFEQQGEHYILELKNGNTVLHATLKELNSQFGVSHFEIIGSDSLAFDHAKIIASALSAIRSRAKDFEYLFDFLPEKFTLTALQQVQETIMNIEVLPANFRRKVSAYVEQTEDYTEGAGHRPAQLYTRKKQ